MMEINPLLAEHGFERDPFSSTNADDEPHLSEYFVPPPYFPAIVGDKRQPRSTIVFAPRGAGKTAQRKMLELEDDGTNGVMCVVYDEFGLEGRRRVAMPLEQHLAAIAQRVALRVLVVLDESEEARQALTENQKRVLRMLVLELLGEMTSKEFEVASRSLATLGDRISEFITRYGAAIEPLINALMEKMGLAGDVDLPEADVERLETSILHKLSALVKIAQAMGFLSVYVLVDRVDELAATSQDPDAAFALIEALLMDLPVLETDGLAVKFFLWDQTEAHFDAAGGRRDRLPVHSLDWKSGELVRMLQDRLAAHSNGRVGSMQELTSEEVTLDLDRLVVLLAAESPRDMIRLCDRIVAEQTRGADGSTTIGYSAVMEGVRSFSEERARELFSGDIAQLKRVRSPVFTNKDIQRVFRIKVASARNKITNWGKSGLVDKVGESEDSTGAGRREYVYGVLDPRLAIAINPHMALDEILADLLFVCSDCETIAATNREVAQCVKCANVFEIADAESLYGHVYRT